MRFIFGVIVGTLIGPTVYREVDKKYGHILVPKLQNLIERIDAWSEKLEERE